MNKHAAVLLPLLFLAACGSYKAVRPSVQTPVVAESQTYSVNYKGPAHHGRLHQWQQSDDG